LSSSAAMTLSLVLPGRAAELTVSAAASLTDSFTELKTAFEAAHPGITVTSNFAASGQLFRQIEQGAPVDVFASADQNWMDRAEQAGLIVPATRRNFAFNELVLAVPAGNPAVISSLEDLYKKDVQRIGMATPESVPVGNYAKTSLIRAGVWDELAPKLIFGESVRQVLDYLARGEVDAGFVYATDAATRKAEVKIVTKIPTEEPVSYPIAVVAGSRHQDAAQAFVAFTTGKQGQAVLARWGFMKP
jgi:molybdate transport system substrate-binding protein